VSRSCRACRLDAGITWRISVCLRFQPALWRTGWRRDTTICPCRAVIQPPVRRLVTRPGWIVLCRSDRAGADTRPVVDGRMAGRRVLGASDRLEDTSSW